LEAAARSATPFLLLVVLALIVSGCGTLSSAVRLDSSVLATSGSVESSTDVARAEAPARVEPSTDVALAERPTGVESPADIGRLTDIVLARTAPEPEKVAAADKPVDDDASAQRAATEKLPDIPDVEEYDPWEPFNETMFEFNRKLDKWILKPVAQAWNVVMPQPFQVLFANGFDNLGVAPRFINNLLQAKWGGAAREMSRFLINTTLGIAGLFDPAKDYWGIEKSAEDFGQTLGRWGVGPGPYLILPFLTPLTVRDGIGKAVDALLDPFTLLVPYTIVERLAVKAGEVVNDRALNIDLFQGFEESVIDMYSAVRHAYLQRRERHVRE
jgi:phospholipid-binding lipoprotein MlaA